MLTGHRVQVRLVHSSVQKQCRSNRMLNYSWPDAGLSVSGHLQRASIEEKRWPNASVDDDRTLVKFWSEETASSDKFAHCARVELTGASSQKDRRVLSPWYLLSWPPTIMFCMRGYKYLSHSSMGGLLLICSAEKHLWSTRDYKSLVGWLRFDNPKLRTSLVHRE
jgi:hypothetical protein